MPRDFFAEEDPIVMMNTSEMKLLVNVTYRSGVMGCEHGEIDPEPWFFVNLHHVLFADYQRAENDAEIKELFDNAVMTTYVIPPSVHQKLMQEVVVSSLVAAQAATMPTVHEPSKDEL